MLNSRGKYTWIHYSNGWTYTTVNMRLYFGLILRILAQLPTRLHFTCILPPDDSEDIHSKFKWGCMALNQEQEYSLIYAVSLVAGWTKHSDTIGLTVGYPQIAVLRHFCFPLCTFKTMLWFSPTFLFLAYFWWLVHNYVS